MPNMDKIAKKISFKDVFNEAISIEDARKLGLTRKNSGAYKISKLDEIFKGKDRIVKKIIIGDENVISSSPLYRDIVNFLSGLGYYVVNVDNYIKGIAYKSDDNYFKQPLRVGKILNKLSKSDNEIVSGWANKYIKEFRDDPTRSTKKDQGYSIVISRHPYDIAGMSTDRNWSSCMNLGLKKIHYNTDRAKGTYSGHVMNDIRQGSIIAYLVDNSDRHSNGKLAINRPLARILMKPFINSEGDYAYSLGGLYGAPVSEFKETIKEWLVENINKDTNGTYQIAGGLYADNEQYPNFKGTTQSEIPKSVMMEIIADMEDAPVDKISLLDFGNGEYGGRFVDIEVKFSITILNKNLEDFSFDSVDKLPPYCLEILEKFPKEFAEHWKNIKYDKSNKDLIITIQVYDNYYQEEEDKDGVNIPQDDDAETDYWYDFYKYRVGLDDWDYEEMDVIVNTILKKANPSRVADEELSYLKTQFRKSVAVPAVQSLKKNVEDFWPTAIKLKDYYLNTYQKYGLEGFYNLISKNENDFIENSKKLNTFFINFKLLGFKIWKPYNDTEYTVLKKPYDIYDSLVRDYVNTDKFVSDFDDLKKLSRILIMYGPRNKEVYDKIKTSESYDHDVFLKLDDFLGDIQPYKPYHMVAYR
jgi:hypothetical protein